MNEKSSEIIYGVYFHQKKGLAIARPSSSKGIHWEIDKNKKSKIEVCGMTLTASRIETGTGSYFFYHSLKGYTYIGELWTSYALDLRNINFEIMPVEQKYDLKIQWLKYKIESNCENVFLKNIEGKNEWKICNS